MFDPVLETSAQAGPAWEKVFQAVLAVTLLSGLACETYSFFWPILAKTSSSPIQPWLIAIRRIPDRTMRIRRDYVSYSHPASDQEETDKDKCSGVYYKPFGRKEPVIIRSPDAIQELSEASELSQRAVYADIFGFRHTMSNNEIKWDPNEQINLRYRLFARAIRINGLAQIRTLQAYLQTRLAKTFEEMVEPQLHGEEWSRIKIAPIMRDLATGMLGVYHFGDRLCNEPDFSTAMSRYYEDTVACMGAFQVVPTIMQPLMHRILTKNGHALDVLTDRLHRAAVSEGSDLDGNQELKSTTLFHNMIEASADSKYWTHSLVIQALLGIWFAASHQPWINLHFVFLELCARPEFVELIRQEIQGAGELDYDGINQLPILDSFIKESVRANPLDKMGIRRKALKPFTFSHGGPHVPVGQIACVPAWDLMHDAEKYPNPNTFDGLRFIPTTHDKIEGESSNPLRGSTFTDASIDFPIWGLGSKVCPGRWHAALVIKMALIHLISNYDFRLENKPESYRWFWETFQMPYESSHVLMRRRKGNESSCGLGS